jgi:hypothetical protein
MVSFVRVRATKLSVLLPFLVALLKPFVNTYLRKELATLREVVSTWQEEVRLSKTSSFRFAFLLQHVKKQHDLCVR